MRMLLNAEIPRKHLPRSILARILVISSRGSSRKTAFVEFKLKTSTDDLTIRTDVNQTDSRYVRTA